jgi:hypothetical protein
MRDIKSSLALPRLLLGAIEPAEMLWDAMETEIPGSCLRMKRKDSSNFRKSPPARSGVRQGFAPPDIPVIRRTRSRLRHRVVEPIVHKEQGYYYDTLLRARAVSCY